MRKLCSRAELYWHLLRVSVTQLILQPPYRIPDLISSPCYLALSFGFNISICQQGSTTFLPYLSLITVSSDLWERVSVGVQESYIPSCKPGNEIKGMFYQVVFISQQWRLHSTQFSIVPEMLFNTSLLDSVNREFWCRWSGQKSSGLHSHLYLPNTFRQHHLFPLYFFGLSLNLQHLWCANFSHDKKISSIFCSSSVSVLPSPENKSISLHCSV